MMVVTFCLLSLVLGRLILEVLLDRGVILLGGGKIAGLEVLASWLKAWAMGLLLCDEEVELLCGTSFCSAAKSDCAADKLPGWSLAELLEGLLNLLEIVLSTLGIVEAGAGNA